MKLFNKVCNRILLLGSIVLIIQYAEIAFGGTDYNSPIMLGIALISLKLFMIEEGNKHE